MRIRPQEEQKAMNKDKFNDDVEIYMREVLAECGSDPQKARTEIGARLLACEENTLPYALNFCALQILPA